MVELVPFSYQVVLAPIESVGLAKLTTPLFVKMLLVKVVSARSATV